jgi:hypothetical protein
MADAHRFVLTTPVLPWPTDQGSKYFQLEVARGLLSLGGVCWVTREIGDQSAAIERLRGEGFDLRLDHSFRNRSLPARLGRRLLTEWRARTDGVAREEVFVCTPEVRRLVAQARGEAPRAIGVSVYWSATPVLETFSDGRRVYAVSDIDSIRESRGPRAADLRVAESERRALQRADLALLLSEQDRADALELLAGSYAPRFGRCPVSIEIPAAPPPQAAGGALLVYGHWEAAFNRDGLRWFLHEIWPKLRAHPSKPRLRIAGAGDPEAVADERVEWVGFVPDLQAELARSRAVLIPLRYASGLRYRLLESCAHARCVLATEVAARGSGAVDGEHYLKVSDPASWAAALDRLDPSLAKRAYEWVCQEHSRAGLADRWARALAPVLPPADRT